MKQNCVKIALMAVVAGAMLAGCGGSKMATQQQKAAADRGAKLDKEECEQLATDAPKDKWRAAGNGTSPKEAFAKSLAELNAKTRLARQLEEQINSLIRDFNQQHAADDANALVGKSSEITEGYVDKLLTNVRTICSTTYVKKDGTFNAYVCVEMGEQGLIAIQKKLTDDKKLSIDFAEHQFKQDMQKAKEDYRNQR